MLHSMDDDLLVHAPAKLNLALSVGAPRPDGLHPLSSWMVTLGWGDSIYLRRRDPGSSSLFANVWAADAPHTPDLDWPLRSDLAWKAHAAIERAVGRQLPVRVRVEKLDIAAQKLVLEGSKGNEPRRDPQLVHRGSFVEVPTPWEGKVMPGLASPVRIRGLDAPLRAAPRIGADSDAVLTGSGFDAGEVAALRASGALG